MMTTEEATRKTLQEIEEMQAVNAVLPEIKKVIARFDGKVLNKRLDDALKEAGPQIFRWDMTLKVIKIRLIAAMCPPLR